MNFGLLLVSSNIFDIYSDTMLKKSKLVDPRNNIKTIAV